jgi:hypothetical protein
MEPRTLRRQRLCKTLALPDPMRGRSRPALEFLARAGGRTWPLLDLLGFRESVGQLR